MMVRWKKVNSRENEEYLVVMLIVGDEWLLCVCVWRLRGGGQGKAGARKQTGQPEQRIDGERDGTLPSLEPDLTMGLRGLEQRLPRKSLPLIENHATPNASANQIIFLRCVPPGQSLRISPVQFRISQMIGAINIPYGLPIICPICRTLAFSPSPSGCELQTEKEEAWWWDGAFDNHQSFVPSSHAISTNTSRHMLKPPPIP